MKTIIIDGIETPLPTYHGGYENDHEWALHLWEDRINNGTVYSTIKKHGAKVIEDELKKLVSYCMGCITRNNSTKFHNDMWEKLVSIMHEELADVFQEETMYLVMHGGESGLLHSTANSRGMTPIALLKQLIKKFPEKKEFKVCCCYSKYCFPERKIEYNGATLTPIIWSEYPVRCSHKAKHISDKWEVDSPYEDPEEDEIRKSRIWIEDWCHKNHINFKSLIFSPIGNWGDETLYGCPLHLQTLANKWNIDIYDVEERYGCIDDLDTFIGILKFLYPRYKLRTRKIGKRIYPDVLIKKYDWER